MTDIKEPRLSWVKTLDEVIETPMGSVTRPTGNWTVKFPINNDELPPLLDLQYVPVMYSDGYYIGTVLNTFKIRVEGNLFDPSPAQLKMEEQLTKTLFAVSRLFRNAEDLEVIHEEATKESA